jgi:hypothetical protein
MILLQQVDTHHLFKDERTKRLLFSRRPSVYSLADEFNKKESKTWPIKQPEVQRLVSS